MKIGQIVFDNKGYEYSLEKILPDNSGYLVRRFYIFSEADEYCEEIGNEVIFLEKVYTEKPVEAKLKEIEELDKKIKKLKSEFLEKQREIERIENTPAEKLLKDKLKEIKGADILIDALTSNLSLYQLDVNYCNVCELTYGAVAVNLKTKDVLLFKQDIGDTWQQEYLYKNYHTSQEVAEKAAIQRIITGFYNPPYNYSEALKLDKLFDKYGQTRPQKWIDDLINIKNKEIKNSKTFIENREKEIQECEEKIKKEKEKIKLLESEVK